MLLRNFFFKQLLPAVLSTALFSAASYASVPPQPWPKDAFLPVTDARIANLPETEQVAWRKYMEASRRIATAVPVRAPDKSPMEAPKKSTGARHSRSLKTEGPDSFFAREEMYALAEGVVAWQSPVGGWTKGIDYLTDPRENKTASDSWSAGTFDNSATVAELRFLARVISAAPDGEPRVVRWRESFLRGLQYVFNAQYPNGGYPQIFPLVGGYHDAITYNDNAMGRVLELLGDVASGQAGCAFVPEEQRAEAARRLALGIECVLKTQIVEASGRRTVWCQQHDMLTLKPCAARNFEPIAASAAESTALVRLLMKRAKITPDVLSALDDAVTWFEKVALRDVVWDRSELPKPSRLAPSPGAPLLWARMYEIETDKPVFGDRDRQVYYQVGEISPERQKGYAWFVQGPDSTCKDYKKWRAQLATPTATPKSK